MTRLAEQLQRNSLALISLVIAITALTYNTWRNELTEENRNIRMAGFEILVHIGELQRITYLAHYDRDNVEGNPRRGWVEVMILTDLGELMPAPLPELAGELRDTWQQNWEGLGTEDAAVDSIDSKLDALRRQVQVTLEALD